MADEGGAQQAVQGGGGAPLGVLQPCRDGVDRVMQRPPVTSAPSKGGGEGLGAGDGRCMGWEGKVADGVRRRCGQGGGGGGGGGPVACRANTAGSEGLEEEEVRVRLGI